jgi:hypothetical protein
MLIAGSPRLFAKNELGRPAMAIGSNSVFLTGLQTIGVLVNRLLATQLQLGIFDAE